jgi:hypothetical protein
MIRSGRPGEAIVFSVHENVDREVRRGHMPSWVGTTVHAFPSRVGAGMVDLLLRHERPRSGNVAWRELVASLPAELDPVLDTEGTLQEYRQLDARVLLMYGSETDPMFVDCAEALHAVPSALDRAAAAGTEPRLGTDLRQAGDDRRDAAAVLRAMKARPVRV